MKKERSKRGRKKINTPEQAKKLHSIYSMDWASVQKVKKKSSYKKCLNGLIGNGEF
jgi:hypothetical protein